MSGRKKDRYCLVGENIKNSLSPEIFNLWFRECGIFSEYVLCEVSESQFYSKFPIILNNYAGINVTSPYKIACKKFLNKVDSSSITINGGVNVIKESKGYNTDIKGFLSALEKMSIRREFDVSKKFLILGAGATSLMISDLLIQMDKRVDVFFRGKEVLSEFSKKHYFVDDPKSLIDNTYDFVVNCTQVFGLLKESVSCKNYLDLNYRKNEGVFAKNMLIFQAAEAFKIWFGFRPKINEDIREILKI